VRQVNASAFSFKYSPRPGTPGAEMTDQVPEAVGTSAQRLQALLLKQQQEFGASLVGSIDTDREAGSSGRPEGGRSLRPVIVDEKAGVSVTLSRYNAKTGYNSCSPNWPHEGLGR
jgi:tRNA-2-methylthio-N6-dimethylallyladenosine synthase